MPVHLLGECVILLKFETKAVKNLFWSVVMENVTSVLCNRNKASLEQEDELKVYEIIDMIYATN